jgi:hypothetical protein
MSTGAAATVSAIHCGQNTRGLIHRYRAQEREIAVWLSDFQERYQKILGGEELEPEDGEIRRSIIQFEELMIKELCDWSYISTHDSVEIGP